MDSSCVLKIGWEKVFHITFIEVHLVECSLVVLCVFIITDLLGKEVLVWTFKMCKVTN